MAKWIGQKLLALLGSILLLAWWAFTGDGDYDTDAGSMMFSEAELPSIVDGGGHQLTVDLDTSEPVTFTATFECDSDGEEPISVGGQEKLGAGSHSLSFDVAGDCWYGILEAEPSDPPVGANLAWTVHVDGELLKEEEVTLEKPLEKNYAFFVQAGWEDYTLDEIFQWMQERG
jgi:hypothetical protein